MNSRSASNLDHASSTQPNNLSNVTSKTQKELYKAELAKVWDIVYKERQKVSTAEKKVKSLQKELAKLKVHVSASEREQENWLRDREEQIKMRYKAKKESLRAQLRSKQTD